MKDKVVASAIIVAGLAIIALAVFDPLEARASPNTGALLRLMDGAPGMANGSLGSGTTFGVTCDASDDGVAIGEATPTKAWVALYCENNSTTSVFWGWPVSATLDTSVAPCISTTTASRLRSSLSLDVKRSSGLACKVASGTQVIKCVAGAP